MTFGVCVTTALLHPQRRCMSGGRVVLEYPSKGQWRRVVVRRNEIGLVCRDTCNVPICEYAVLDWGVRTIGGSGRNHLVSEFESEVEV